ncbi:MAG: TRAP transporter large permease [candidate division NC10 bacterium]|nr:TRAP transporter large permease [candidate division NC10 bacterium]MBI2163376.1 TRAP transporter large permease [candidate division NC10 bacterium]MBI2456991.1 TRAP transporter large permease [candidate division NC10 bacterium]MBI2561105.1 TRAP transporter large permease [candidate division NC10 bacterium]
MTDPSVWLFVTFLVLVGLGVPIAIAVGVSGAVFLWYYQLGIQILSANIYGNIAKFQLLAIPFFILAGLILDRVGISQRLVHLVNLLIGRTTGGLALVAVVVCVFFAGISGSGPADTAALGTVLIPAMVAKGYDTGFASALIASGGSIAIIIPPSIAFIIYGVITATSIPALFAAGIFPGIVVGLALMIPAYLISRARGYAGERFGTRAEIWQAFKDSIWGLMAPLVILGGIYGGIFTPTEAAVVAVFYGLFVGAVVHRNLTWTILYSTLRDAALSSAVVMVIVAFAGLFAWAGSTLGAMDKAAAFIISLSGSPWVTILWVNLLLFIAGMLLDAVSIYYVFLPIFLPVMAHFHWDPIWFGVVMTVNLAIGQVTPPVAVNLYVAANLARISLETISRAVVPFVLAMLGALLVIIYLPFLSTWLPKLLRLY